MTRGALVKTIGASFDRWFGGLLALVGGAGPELRAARIELIAKVVVIHCAGCLADKDIDLIVEVLRAGSSEGRRRAAEREAKKP